MSGSYVGCEFVQRCWLEVVEKSPICLIDESGIALYIADFDFHLRTSPHDEKQMRKRLLVSVGLCMINGSEFTEWRHSSTRSELCSMK